MLTGRGIRKSYNGVEVLHGIDIKIQPAQITVLIGPSGAGKTTVFRTLSLLDLPETGTVSIDDTSYSFPMRREQKIKPPWPNITVVFQQLFLWPHMTLRENITLPIPKNEKERRKKHLDEFIELFDMGHFIDRLPNEVSLGEQQRAALVRALILKPSYLLLDEVTSALDVEMTAIVLSYLDNLRKQGVGILLSTHQMGFAQHIADNVVFLDQGAVLESGGLGILSRPRTERLHQFLSLIENDVDERSQLLFVADAVVARIKNGFFPGDVDANYLNRPPLIDIIRSKIKSKDVSRLIKMVEHSSGPQAALALNLLRDFSRQDNVKAALRERWDRANTTLRCHLIWRILDDPDLPLEWHRKLFEFVLTKWETFNKVQVTLWSSHQKSTVKVLQKLEDKTLPEAKKWIYLCCLPEVAEDRSAAEKLTYRFLSSPNSFTRDVAKRLLLKFYSVETV